MAMAGDALAGDGWRSYGLAPPKKIAQNVGVTVVFFFFMICYMILDDVVGFLGWFHQQWFRDFDDSYMAICYDMLTSPKSTLTCLK